MDCTSSIARFAIDRDYNNSQLTDHNAQPCTKISSPCPSSSNYSESDDHVCHIGFADYATVPTICLSIKIPPVLQILPSELHFASQVDPVKRLVRKSSIFRNDLITCIPDG